jgi:hypothetical protein
MREYVIVRPYLGADTEPSLTIRCIVERPLQRLSEDKVNALPDKFRCYCCQGEFKKSQIGGIELGQRLCKDCWPFLDEWGIGSIIRFDLKHSKPVEGYGCPKINTEIKPEKFEDGQIEELYRLWQQDYEGGFKKAYENLSPEAKKKLREIFGIKEAKMN